MMMGEAGRPMACSTLDWAAAAEEPICERCATLMVTFCGLCVKIKIYKHTINSIRKLRLFTHKVNVIASWAVSIFDHLER